MRIISSLLAGLMVLGFASTAFPQTPNLGFNPEGVYQRADIDAVDLEHFNGAVKIPLLSYPQRGSIKSLDFNAYANTNIWTPIYIPDGGEVPTGQYTAGYNMVDGLNGWIGPKIAIPQIVRSIGADNSYVDADGYLYDSSNSWIQDADGALHALVVDATSIAAPHTQADTSFRTVDGSGYGSIGGIPYDSAGRVLAAANYPALIDPDGNVVSNTIGAPSNGFFPPPITDTIGRNIPSAPYPNFSAPSISSRCPTTIQDSTQALVASVDWTVPATGTSTKTYTICFTTLNIRTNMWQYGGAGFLGDYVCDDEEDCSNNRWTEVVSAGFPAIQSIVLPDGTYWGFKYDSVNPDYIPLYPEYWYPSAPTPQAGKSTPPTCTNDLSVGPASNCAWGVLTKIIEPSGGSISYSYTLQADPNFNAEPLGAVRPVISKRTVSTDSNGLDANGNDRLGITATWQYDLPGASVRDPEGNDTAISATGPYTYDSLWSTTYTKSMIWYSGHASAGVIAKRTDSSYTSILGPMPNNYPGYLTQISDHLNSTTTTVDGVTEGTKEVAYSFWLDITAPSCVQDPTYKTWICDHGYGSVIVPLGIPLGTTTKDASGTIISQDYSYPVALSNPTYWNKNLLDFPAYTTSSDGLKIAETDYAYDSSHLTHQLSATSISSGGGINPVVQKSWTTYGMVASITDPKLNTTTFGYDSSGAFVSSVTQPNTSIVDHYTWDDTSGALQTHTDPNGNVTTYTYDLEGRPWSVHNPDTPSGFESEVACYPSSTQIKVYQAQGTIGLGASLPSSGFADSGACPSSGTSGAMLKTVNLDGLNRVTSSILRAPEGNIETDTSYDALDRVSSVTNPYLVSSGPTGYSVSTTYDALSRPRTMVEQDGSTKTFSYSGLTTTAIDEANNNTITTNDFLGRTTGVYEPTANGPQSTSAMLHTSYTYNLYGLTGVTQSGASGESARTRSFIYDGLGRLSQTTNPETGTITYSYLNGSSLCAGDLSLPCGKTDARTITTTYSYDSLNRLTSKTFSTDTTGEQAEHYVYDSVGGWGSNPITVTNQLGRLAMQYTGQTASNTFPTYGSLRGFSYDPMGRPLVQEEMFPSEAVWTFHATAFAYDLAGHLTDTWYPRDQGPWDGPRVHQGYDIAGRLSSVALVNSGNTAVIQNYLSSISYYPNGSPSLSMYGNGVTQSVSQNSRLQTTALTAANASSYTIMDRTYSYAPADGLSGSCAATSGNRDTGNIWKITDNRNSGWTRIFKYDCMDRLTGSQKGSASPTTFAIDSFGNMSQLVGGSPVNTFDAATNRINNLPCHTSGGLTDFDAAGNQICDSDPNGANRIYAYDAEERPTGITMAGSGSPFVSYSYTPDGDRARKTNADGRWTEYQWSGGQILAEKDNIGNWTDYIYAGGQKIAKVIGTDSRLHFTGTNSTSGLAWDYTVWNGSFTIQSGDRLTWRQYQEGPAAPQGGVGLLTTDNTYTNWWMTDTDGQVINSDTTQNAWHYRVVDLTPIAGKTLATMWINEDSSTGAGYWQEYFSDIVLLHPDGTVVPIYTGEPGVALGGWGPAGVSGITFADESVAVTGPSDPAATRYYLDDHLGTAQYELSSAGWPVWQGQFGPWGSELSTDNTSFNYKFTGKERDTESGNDYFGARYYASTMGRFLSPDWSAKVAPVPYAKLDNPQSLNLYAYVGNNPLSRRDLDGHTDVLADCKGKASCSETVTQTVGIYHYDSKTKASVLDSTLSVSTKFNVTTDAKGNVNVAASSTVANVSGYKYSDSQLSTMGKEIGAIQQSAATMGFGPNTTQLMTAVGSNETAFGTARAGEKSPYKAPDINPLQLSGGRANGDLMHNIQGALDVFDYFGSKVDFAPIPTYSGYSDNSTPTMTNFTAVWGSVTEGVQ